MNRIFVGVGGSVVIGCFDAEQRVLVHKRRRVMLTTETLGIYSAVSKPGKGYIFFCASVFCAAVFCRSHSGFLVVGSCVPLFLPVALLPLARFFGSSN